MVIGRPRALAAALDDRCDNPQQRDGLAFSGDQIKQGSGARRRWSDALSQHAACQLALPSNPPRVSCEVVFREPLGFDGRRSASQGGSFCGKELVMHSTTLLEAFSGLEDPRCTRGVRHPFAGMVVLMLLGMLARIRETEVLVRWAMVHLGKLREPLGFHHHRE